MYAKHLRKKGFVCHNFYKFNAKKNRWAQIGSEIIASMSWDISDTLKKEKTTVKHPETIIRKWEQENFAQLELKKRNAQNNNKQKPKIKHVFFSPRRNTVDCSKIKKKHLYLKRWNICFSKRRLIPTSNNKQPEIAKPTKSANESLLILSNRRSIKAARAYTKINTYFMHFNYYLLHTL